MVTSASLSDLIRSHPSALLRVLNINKMAEPAEPNEIFWVFTILLNMYIIAIVLNSCYWFLVKIIIPYLVMLCLTQHPPLTRHAVPETASFILFARDSKLAHKMAG